MANAIRLSRSPSEHTCLSAVVATGAGTALDVSEYDNVLIMVSSASGTSTTATFKAQGTGKQAEPTWGSAQAVANHWDYVEIIDLEDGSVIDGDTGVTLSAQSNAASTRQYEVNTNTLTWLNVNVTAWTAGAITVWLRGYKNS